MHKHHPIRRALRQRGLDSLWPVTRCWWHPSQDAGVPYANPHAWVCGGAQQLPLTVSTPAKYIYDERSKLIHAVPANALGWGAPQEPARTNLWLRNTDLQNAGAHGLNTATNITVADGGSAGVYTHNFCTLTATAGNGTFTQAITATVASYTTSFWIRRRTGSGAIELTADGSTWAAVTVTGLWSRVSVTQTASAAALNIGLRIVTSGDAVDVDLAQYELGAYPSSTIPTLGVSVARAADAVRCINAGIFGPLANEGSLLWVGRYPYASNTPATVIAVGLNGHATNANNSIQLARGQSGVATWFSIMMSGGVQQTSMPGLAGVAGQLMAAMVTWRTNNVNLYFDGALKTTDTSATMPETLDRLEIGGVVSSDTRSGAENFLVACFGRALSSAEARTLTAVPEALKWAN